ncbi:hypothetical protein F511_29070 [Dorcoceras hygrometricum]|uniref:Uncharacterized protein n=1 Tax=Dorcoceras hygrometricum TaxID=472368 RepID=A0A2Z7D3S1_9LAMI|nr:hypothetical protein F511_29070 [Dorcoceras hygrometricum]
MQCATVESLYTQVTVGVQVVLMPRCELVYRREPYCIFNSRLHKNKEEYDDISLREALPRHYDDICRCTTDFSFLVRTGTLCIHATSHPTSVQSCIYNL